MLDSNLLDSLRNARHVAVLTGAGISAESGIPTFRDAMEGLWQQVDPRKLATPEGFLEDPKQVWEWYAWRRERVGQCQPNAGHRALVDMARCLPRFTLITQNVDGLHQAAGSQHVIELHGNIRRVKCFDYGHPAQDWDASETPPHCTLCGSMLRPDVVWFGEMLPATALNAAVQASEHCDVFLSVGTSAQVYPAADLAYQALDRGARVIEVNAEPTPLTDHAHFSLLGKAGEHLPELIREAWG